MTRKVTVEQKVRELLEEILTDVPLAREHGTPDVRLAALLRAALFFPVFRNDPAPVVTEWLDEAERIARELQDKESLTLVRIRRAVVLMRRNELPAALWELDALRADGLSDVSDPARGWEAATRARVQTRLQDFAAARQALDEAAAVRLDEDVWVAPLVRLARGELQLETNEVHPAETTLRAVAKSLAFELIEERVQVLQSLAFLRITNVDAPAALRLLDKAREILRGAGAWSEVIQMDLVSGQFLLAAGRAGEAEERFTEALELCETSPQPQLEPVLHLGLSRARAAGGDLRQAADACVRAAVLFAEQGNHLGYLSMISVLHSLQLEERDYPSAYRTLAIGLSLAKRWRMPLAESLLRSQVERMRNEILGPEEFDAMVREMIRQTGKEV
jgi:tetratricopeptide (TPR) repeat protein